MVDVKPPVGASTMDCLDSPALFPASVPLQRGFPLGDHLRLLVTRPDLTYELFLFFSHRGSVPLGSYLVYPQRLLIEQRKATVYSG